MFDRKKLKHFSLIQLKGRWTVPVAMTLITFIIIALFSGPSDVKFVNALLDWISQGGTYNQFIINYDEPAATRILSILSNLVGYIFTFAAINVYIALSHGPEKISFANFFEGFAKWFRAILAGLWVQLWTGLWTLLFVIPGIVKAIAYSQTFFLLVEYPNLSVTKAMRISIAITNGYKSDLFMLWLSFLGWAIVACATGGIGFLWLAPYFTMTQTNAYHWLLKRAVDSRTITLEDLGVQESNC